MELKKLSEDALNRQPEDVFDILSKLGEGSYGSVYKSIHKESRQVLAIKQVPVDTDLQEIIKEISIMQQCDSPYVVKYYGSYFKNTDLWIVMEYCGAGSVLDIMKLRGLRLELPRGEVKTLNEDEIATILSDTLKGLEYLHIRKKIHRDIKAGNILLNSEGHAKLADFGVAGQLTDTMAKRNTVIGTPFWMAPEVIQEIGYDCVADIWSLGITSLEMAEGKAPYGEIHPMRAIFMIPNKPPPSFNHPDKWTPQFIDFASRCLVKNPEERATASELLQHDFIKNAKPPEILAQMISEAQEMREHLLESAAEEVDDSGEGRTMVPCEDGTLVRNPSSAVDPDYDDGGTMIHHATLVPDRDTISEVVSDLGTMVINNDDDDEDDDTMKRHNTASLQYRPAFMDHFEKKSHHDQQEQLSKALSNYQQTDDHKKVASGDIQTVNSEHSSSSAAPSSTQQNEQALQRRLQQIAGGQPIPHENSATDADPNVRGIHSAGFDNAVSGIGGGVCSGDENHGSEKGFQRCIAEGDLEFLKFMSYEDLKYKMSNLDYDMEREIDDLRRRYQAKRQPILDAMDQKRKRQQNF